MVRFRLKGCRTWLDDNWRRHLSRELVEKLTVIEAQAAAIRQLSTPILEIWDRVLALPIIGTLDNKRVLELTTTLLDRIQRDRAECIILDITGVEIVDTSTANHLLRVVRATRLLGTACILTGMSAKIAQTLVGLGAEFESTVTLRSLKDGLKHYLSGRAKRTG